MKLGFKVAFAVLLLGCDAKTGSSAQMPDIGVYPGAAVVSNGENHGIIGANLTVVAPQKDVIAYYAKELGVTGDQAGSGSLDGSHNGHAIHVIVTDAGQGKTAVVITQPK